MKTKIPLIVTLSGLVLLTGFALAATTPAVPPPAPVAAPASPPDEFSARMAEKLGLSPEQRKALAELRAKQQAELMALLTPEQQKKAGEMRGQFRERLQRFAQGRQSGGQNEHRGPAMQTQPGAPANPLEIVAMGERIKDRIAEKLQLTDEQQDKLEHLGRAFRAEQRDAVKKHLEEMRAVLTPEQQDKFEQWKLHSRHGAGAQFGPDTHRPPVVGMDDEPEGPMIAGMDLGPEGRPEAGPGELPPLPGQ